MTALVHPTIWGVDPSSAKLAVVVGEGTNTRFYVKRLPGGPDKRPLACAEAYKFGVMLAERYPDTALVGLERPIVAAKALVGVIPQAMISGAFQAALSMAGIPVDLIDISLWKKSTTSYGNASKEEVSQFIQENYPDAFEQCWDEQRNRVDQDLLDAYGIWLHSTARYHIQSKMIIMGSQSRAAHKEAKARARRATKA